MTSRSCILAWSLAAVVLAAPVAAQEKPPAGERLGTVHFPTSCRAEVRADFDRAVALLHSFWLDAAARAFAAVAQADPACGLAYWGVAMTALGNPFAWPPAPQALAEGRAAIERARAAGAGTQRERDWIAALETFYREADSVDHRTRAVAYEQAMAALAARYPEDREAAIFHALALNATALPADKTYAQQLRAAAILERAFAEQPDHPGVAHYLIHSYDYPAIADRGLPAARRYAGIAPSAPHALHMPSHIFTRRGFWRDSIESNRVSAAAARNDFDRLHAMDYLAYAYLQQGQDAEARRVLEQARALTKIAPEHFVTAYALAAIPSRLALERGQWAEAAGLALHPADFPWSRFPQSEAVLVFARGLGAARGGDAAGARQGAQRLAALRDALAAARLGYWVEQVDIQRQVVLAWAAWAEGQRAEALAGLRAAADREDATDKHPVTPGPIAPARELVGEMLLAAGEPAQALAAFAAALRVEPNRYRSLAGAAQAAEQAGNRARARTYYGQLLTLTRPADAERAEVRQARAFFGGK